MMRRLAGVSWAMAFCAMEVAFAHEPLTWRDLDEACSEYLMTVTGPAGFSPEEILRTILGNPKLPRHIRMPFVELAKAKAPHLLDAAH